MSGDVQSRTRVAIVDDHAMVRSGLAAFLSVSEDFELVGEAENGTHLVSGYAR